MTTPYSFESGLSLGDLEVYRAARAASAPLAWIAKQRGLAQRYVSAGLRPTPAI